MRFAVLLLAIGFVACGSTGNEPEMSGPSSARETDARETDARETSATDPASSHEQPTSELRASGASVELGLDRWEFEGGGIYGLTRDGEVLAEFHIQPDNAAVESILPMAGLRRTDGSEDFPPAAAKFYEALALDIQAMSSSGERAAVPVEVEKAVVNCFLILDNCLAEAVQRQVLFGQSCSCALNINACSIFLPLALDCI